MGYDGTGVFTPPSPEFPAVSGNVIRASEFNAIIQDIAAALSLVLVRDGQAPMLAALNMGTKRITSLAAGTTDTDAATVAQARTIPSTATLDGIVVTALMALNGVTPAADGMLYYTSESAAALLTVVAAIRTLLASEDVAAFRANAGLEIGADVQAFTDAGNALAQLEGAVNRIPIFTAADTASYLTVVPAIQTLLGSADLATFRSNAGLAVGSDVLAYNSHVIFDNVAVTLTKAQRQAITAVTDQATIAPDLNASNHLVWELGADRTMPEFTPTAPGLWWWDVSGDYDLTFDAAYEVYGDAYDGSGTNSNVVILTYDGTTKRIYVMSVTEAA